MKIRINLDTFKDDYIYFSQNIEYILSSTDPIVLEQNGLYYTKCIGNGSGEVYVNILPSMLSDVVTIKNLNRSIEVKFIYNEEVLANHYEDVSPPYIEEEYPLFKKLMEYYFKYIGIKENPSGFIHNLEKVADIDETFLEFKDSFYKEFLPYFRGKTAVDKDLLSKYIIQFYNNRGTEDSIRFLLRILYNEEINIVERRKHVLIASHKEQGILSNAHIVLQDNYYSQLFAYVIETVNGKFSEYKDIFYKTVNPSGYLPFGTSIISSTPIEFQTGNVNINA